MPLSERVEKTTQHTTNRRQEEKEAAAIKQRVHRLICERLRSTRLPGCLVGRPFKWPKISRQTIWRCVHHRHQSGSPFHQAAWSHIFDSFFIQSIFFRTKEKRKMKGAYEDEDNWKQLSPFSSHTHTGTLALTVKAVRSIHRLSAVIGATATIAHRQSTTSFSFSSSSETHTHHHSIS